MELKEHSHISCRKGDSLMHSARYQPFNPPIHLEFRTARPSPKNHELFGWTIPIVRRWSSTIHSEMLVDCWKSIQCEVSKVQWKIQVMTMGETILATLPSLPKEQNASGESKKHSGNLPGNIKVCVHSDFHFHSA
jgi:hypothetical protein